MKNDNSLFAQVAIAAITLLLTLGGIGYCQYGTQEQITAKVEDKDIKRNGEVDLYMVYTDQEVLVNSDAMMHGKFNSSDVWANIEIGNCYRFDVFGYRIPLFSSYRNIIKQSEVDCERTAIQ